jgi:hypothetical protein
LTIRPEKNNHIGVYQASRALKLKYVYQVEARGGCAVVVVVISGFMFKTDIKRPSYATPCGQTPQIWSDFWPSQFVDRNMIENTRSQELKGDKHAQEV